MTYLIYFSLAIFATTIGSFTGMGGGIIIKPLMDILGDYDVQTIGLISSIAVFSMALVSVIKQIKAGTKIPFCTAIPLAVGSVAGGLFGQYLLDFIIDSLKANSVATLIQNITLAILVLCVIFYMKNKSKIASKQFDGIFSAIIAGIFLGCCSSFLGIGGGPFNVALMIYLFSYDTKTATVCSIITILFAQMSRLASTALTTGFSGFDLSIAPVMVIGAVSGGFIGAMLNKKSKEKTVEKAFTCIQVFVLLVTFYNIANNLI